MTKKGTNKKAETPAKYAADSANDQDRRLWNLSKIYFNPYYSGIDQASRNLEICAFQLFDTVLGI